MEVYKKFNLPEDRCELTCSNNGLYYLLALHEFNELLVKTINGKNSDMLPGEDWNQETMDEIFSMWLDVLKNQKVDLDDLE